MSKIFRDELKVLWKSFKGHFQAVAELTFRPIILSPITTQNGTNIRTTETLPNEEDIEMTVVKKALDGNENV